MFEWTMMDVLNYHIALDVEAETERIIREDHKKKTK